MVSKMILRRMLRSCALAAIMSAPLPAFAQTSSGDIVMRRPLPNANGASTSTQDGCETTGTCTTTPDPDDPEVPSHQTTTPGFSYDPDGPTMGGDPNAPPGIPQWTTGPWTGTAIDGDGNSVGAAQCGTQSRYTRAIGCEVVSQDSGPIDLPTMSMNVMDNGTRLASYSKDADSAVMSNAVYDPSKPPARLIKAQYSGPSTHTAIDPSYCSAQAGDPPPNTYVGTQGDCDYQSEQQGYSEWTLDPGSTGTATCSADAYRKPIYSCVGPDGQPADIEMCTENVREGGTRNDYTGQYQYQNFDGCRTGWVGEASDRYCTKADGSDTNGGPDSKYHTAYYTYQCMRSDGTVLTDSAEAACTDPKPADGLKIINDCRKVFNFPDTGQGCFVGDSQEFSLGIKDLSPQELYNSSNSSFCTSKNASCCELRLVLNSNYALAGYGQYQIVATSNEPRITAGYHFDENDYRARPDSIEEGPFFRDVGGGGPSYQTQEAAVNDDPNGIVTSQSGPQPEN